MPCVVYLVATSRLPRDGEGHYKAHAMGSSAQNPRIIATEPVLEPMLLSPVVDNMQR